MEAKQAKILSFIHDQGGGFSWCSECETEVLLTDVVCPGCKRELVIGDVSFNQGGSDF